MVNELAFKSFPFFFVFESTTEAGSMLHAYTGAALLPHDAHFWYYAAVFWGICTTLTFARTPRGASLVIVALLAFFLHLKASFDRLVATATLTAYGVFLFLDPTRAPVLPQGTRASFAVEATWCWLHSFPVVAHNLSAVDDFYTDAYASVIVGLVVCAGACALMCEERSTTFCRYPSTFASVAHHAGLCLWARSWVCVGLLWPAHAVFVLEAPGGLAWRQHADDVSKVGDAAYQQWRRDTSPWIPLPRGVYARVPRFVKIFAFHESF